MKSKVFSVRILPNLGSLYFALILLCAQPNLAHVCILRQEGPRGLDARSLKYFGVEYQYHCNSGGRTPRMVTSSRLHLSILCYIYNTLCCISRQEGHRSLGHGMWSKLGWNFTISGCRKPQIRLQMALFINLLSFPQFIMSCTYYTNLVNEIQYHKTGRTRVVEVMGYTRAESYH